MKDIFVMCWVILCCFGELLASGQTAGRIEINGFILSRSGEILILRTAEAGDLLVVLNEITMVITPAAGSRARQTSVTTLVPGMILKVQGMRSDDGQLIARTVELVGPYPVTGERGGTPRLAGNPDQNDPERTIPGQPAGSAGDSGMAHDSSLLAPPEQIQDAQLRFADLRDYVVKRTVDVHFAAGSAAIAPYYKDKLLALAQRVPKLADYLIQIEGFATSTGTAPERAALSQERVDAVIAYLEQIANIPLTHMAACRNGETNILEPKDISHDPNDNRRATVRLLVTPARGKPTVH